MKWRDPVTGKQYGYDWDIGKPSNWIIEELKRSIKTKEEKPKLYSKDFYDAIIERCLYDTRKKENNMRANYHIPAIKEVIFNYPATIVKWADGVKTVVKCSKDDKFDPEKGLLAAMVKRMYGNDTLHNKVIRNAMKKAKHATPVIEKPAKDEDVVCHVYAEGICEVFEDLGKLKGATLFDDSDYADSIAVIEDVLKKLLKEVKE